MLEQKFGDWLVSSPELEAFTSVEDSSRARRVPDPKEQGKIDNPLVLVAGQLGDPQVEETFGAE